jgi:peptide/nickel transport system permease protein
MAEFLVRRALRLLSVAFGVSSAVFFLLRLSGDPVTLFMDTQSSPEEIAAMRHELGFDRPVAIQYLDFLGRAARFDFGSSIRYRAPATSLVFDRIVATLQLSLAALAFAVLVAVPLGMVAALQRGSLIDNACITVTLVGQSVPVFWLGIVLILVLAVDMNLLPTSGYGGPDHFVLPMVTLGAYSMSRIARLTRSGMLEVLSEEYVRTARAKGLRESVVLVRHALKNASLSVVTVVGYTFSALIGGAIITEAIFAWPGVGSLMVQAVQTRDYPLVQASVFTVALLVAAVNMLVDVSYRYLDPRIGG